MKKLSETASKIYLGRLCKNCGNSEKYKVNRTCVNCTIKKASSRPKEVIKACSLKHYKENAEVIKKRQREYKKANRAACNATWMKYHASKLNATPAWLTCTQLEEIQNIYLLAKECEILSGDKYHVDHIVPLQGEDVCGLHVPWNLQVLPADINMSKGNRYEKVE